MKKICLIMMLLTCSCILSSRENMGQIPIIYVNQYNITMFGIEKLQPFETEKYRKVWEYLKKTLNIAEGAIYHPAPATEDDLLLVNTKDYLNSLKKSKVVAQIAEMPLLAIIPGPILDHQLLLPMRYATRGYNTRMRACA